MDKEFKNISLLKLFDLEVKIFIFFFKIETMSSINCPGASSTAATAVGSPSDLTDMFVLLKMKISTTNESFKEVKQLIEFIDTAIDDQKTKLDKQRTELDDHKKKLDKLKKLFLNYTIETRIGECGQVKIDYFDPSAILTSDQKKELNQLCNFSPKTRWALVYRASRDGFGARAFHDRCDGVPKTLTVIKTVNANIFGGFTLQPWDQTGEYISDKNAFIFRYASFLLLLSF